jgi:hypothetical protein
MNKRPSPLVIASSLALAIAFAGSAFAGHPGAHRDHGAAFGEKIDADGDGQVKLAEVEANAAKRAAEIDANADGRIDATELQAHHDKLRRLASEKRLLRFDANGDGSVTVDEFASGQSERIARLDRDADGVISGDELKSRRHGRGHRRTAPAAE